MFNVSLPPCVRSAVGDTCLVATVVPDICRETSSGVGLVVYTTTSIMQVPHLCLRLLVIVSFSACVSHGTDNNDKNEDDKIDIVLSRLKTVKRAKEDSDNDDKNENDEIDILLGRLKAAVKRAKGVQTEKARRDELLKVLAERVIGGSDISKESWPWLVYIEAEYKVGWWRTKTAHCGASLINNKWLLTAAHCVSGQHLGNPTNWHVLLGDNDRDTSLFDKAKGWWCNLRRKTSCIHYLMHVEKIITHPLYSAGSLWYNDIALMKLKKVAPAGAEVPRIRSVTLESDSNFPPDGMQCIMKGWGCTQQGGQLPRIAKQVVLPKINDGRCRRMYRISTFSRLCAGHDLKGKGICSGDSGGPLVCNKNGKWVQVGIASFTSAQKPESYPGVFTRVSVYKSWIRQTMMYN